MSLNVRAKIQTNLNLFEPDQFFCHWKILICIKFVLLG